MCERRSVNGLTGQYLSRWYGLVCCGRFYQCPTRALWQQCEQAIVRPGFVVCVINRSIRLWMVAMLRCWRAWSRSRYSIAVLRPCQPWKCGCCWKRTASFCSPHCSRICYSVLWLEYYHRRLLSVDHSYVVDVWELLGYVPLGNKYPIQRQCFYIWYVRLHICASVGHTMHHNGGLFDSSCVVSRCIETRKHACLCSRSHQS